ncbi:hypothetical protein CRUP_035447 [Coryphaenoides rupestris]|nr:hypothetical protein CRUP_035447 [Coryphaenoides rupestris]
METKRLRFIFLLLRPDFHAIDFLVLRSIREDENQDTELPEVFLHFEDLTTVEKRHRGRLNALGNMKDLSAYVEKSQDTSNIYHDLQHSKR